jgi:pimeloyl-ACP methyl ester carboxylesterase
MERSVLKTNCNPWVNALKNDFDVHSIDFPGHGGKPFSSKPFSIELFARHVLDYTQQNQIENAVVFGYSMGGYVGMYIAKYFPGKISRLITLATKFYWDEAVAAKETKMLDAATIQQKIPAFAKELEMRHAPQDWKEVLHYTKQLAHRPWQQ